VLAAWDAIVSRGVYAVPYSTQAPFSPVDLEDVAEAAAIVLTGQNHSGAIYELAGPGTLTPADMVDLMAPVLARPVRAERISIEDWIRGAKASGMADHAVEALVQMFDYYDRFGLWGNSRVLGDLLGRRPTDFETFVRRIAHKAG
jgi:uncharacterized protein YbjT (DUF2867 family)